MNARSEDEDADTLRFFRAALEEIAGMFGPAELYDSDVLQNVTQVARKALGWHWHVEFHDWRNSPPDAVKGNGTHAAPYFHKDIGCAALDILPLFWTEDGAKSAAATIRGYYSTSTHRCDSVEKVIDCHDADCPAFEKMARLVQAEIDMQRASTQARKDKAARDAADEGAWRAGTREKVK